MSLEQHKTQMIVIAMTVLVRSLISANRRTKDK